MFALVDANNFYVSCERVFRPSLRGRPVIVLSNNDGCAIARSNEAKALGIAMAEPWHMIQAKLPDAGVVALSANFTLYGDISNRFMSIVAGLGPTQEIYSIDECFIELSRLPGDMTARARKVRARVLQWLGIPSCIGIARTKTLAKLANHVAKEAERKPGSYPPELANVCNLSALGPGELDAILAATAVRDIWGIGARISQQLIADGVGTALDLARMPPSAAKARWSVIVERTIRELAGQSCIEFEDAPPPRKEVSCTRAFGDPVEDLPLLIEAVSEYASRAAHKLRQDGTAAAQVIVFVHTNPFRKWERQYSKAITVPLRRPTALTSRIVEAALRGLRAIFCAGYKIHKAGVILTDLQAAGVCQQELALDQGQCERAGLMAVVDRLNDRYGRGSVQVGSAGLGGKQRRWVMKQEWLTPQYTTNWQHLPTANA